MADNGGRPLRYFIWAFCAVIVWGSLASVVGAHGGKGHDGGGMHALALGSLETVAAVAFLVPRLRFTAGVVLLGIFGVAIALTALARESPAHLVFYACTVVFILAADRQA